jgi:hypothetical protein
VNFKNNSYQDKLGQHAFLSPSGYHWVNYDVEKLEAVYTRYQRVKLGTMLHKLAEDLISLKVRLPSTSATLNSFVNDAIGFNLETEVVLYYSDNCFGTVDAIGFDEATKTLRIHDLKTGLSPTSIVQLEVYAALFCLQTGVDPHHINMILRIYQNDEIVESRTKPETIKRIMKTIQDFDLVISSLKNGV